MNTHIRWMIRRDMPEVLEIEAASFEFPWDEEEFVRHLRERNCIGMVAEVEPNPESIEVVAFMVYEIKPLVLDLLSFAVHPDFRRQGLGQQMMQKLISKVDSPYHRKRHVIETHVRESNLPALKFFRSVGFRSAGIFPGFFDHTTDDAYRLRYQKGASLTDDDLDRLFHGA